MAFSRRALPRLFILCRLPIFNLFLCFKGARAFFFFAMAMVCALLSFILSPADGDAKAIKISRMEDDIIRMMADMHNMKLPPLGEDVSSLRVRLMDSFRLRVSRISQLSTRALKLLCNMCDLKPPQSVFFAKTALIDYIETHRHNVDTCLWEEEHQQNFLFSSISKNGTSHSENAGGVLAEQTAGSVLLVQQIHFISLASSCTYYILLGAASSSEVSISHDTSQETEAIFKDVEEAKVVLNPRTLAP